MKKNTDIFSDLKSIPALSPYSIEFERDYFYQLQAFLTKEYDAGKVIFPSIENIFRAIELCVFDDTKVVILGQDPYHGAGQANGLAFSVNAGIKIPPSLKNIYKELQSDLSIVEPYSGDLSSWAKQGVLLLNAVLTVEKGSPGAHQNKGWERFTDSIITKLNEEKSGIVFLLWGNYAKSKQALINEHKHFVLTAPHPSPLSAYQGFLGCKHFSKCNEYLQMHGNPPIDWTI